MTTAEPAATPVTPAGNPSATPANVPAWATSVPEKFRRDTAEATLAELTKSYAALETKLGAAPATKPDPAKPAGAPALPQIEDARAAPTVEETSTFEDVVKAGAIDTAATTREWMANGKLTDDQYAKIQDAWAKTRGGKITRADIDGHLRSEQASLTTQVTAAVGRAHQAVGGEAAFKELLKFGSTLPKELRAELNAQLSSVSGIVAATERLMGIRAASREGTLADGAVAGGGTAGRAFVSNDEMYRAQKESRAKFGDWSRDPSFMARYNATPEQIRRGG